MFVVPAGKLVVSRLSVGAIVMLRVALAVSAAASVIWTVKLKVPAVAGVPLMPPVAGFSTRPAGKVPLLRLQV